MSRNRKVSIAVYILITFTLGACGRGEQAAAPKEVLRPVRTVLISKTDSAAIREFPGVVDALQKADLGFRVAGKLQKIFVKESEIVKRGQKIAQLDQKDFEIRLKSAQANFERTKASYERAEQLLPQGFVSKTDYDQLKADYTQASANLDSARQDLEYTVLRAPFAGIIARRFVENFEEVIAKQPIVALEDLSAYSIKIDVPESVMIRVKTGVQQRRKVYATFDAIKGERFPLTLKETATRPDEQTKTYRVRFTMQPPPGHTILPGMTVTVAAEKRPGEAGQLEGYFIPAHAVLEDRQDRYVFVAKPSAKDIATVERRSVTIGQITAQGIQIVEGLATGDYVITAGMSQLTDGMSVRLTNGN